MTYPVPGEFPDFEQCLVDLLTPIVPTVTSLPATGSDLDAALPLAWVRKVRGTTDVNSVTYTAQLRVVLVATDRGPATQLAGQVRGAVLGVAGTDVNGVLIDWVDEIAPEELKYFPPTVQRSQGSADLPNLDPLDRMVELGFSLQARRQ